MIPDNVEKIIMTKEDYDRNVEQLLLDKCKAELEVKRLNNIINELEKYCNEEIEDYDKHIKSQYITDISKEQFEGEKVCFEDMLYKIRELKGSDKEC